MEQTIFNNIGMLLFEVCVAAFIVFVAMSVDLASGLYKAKLRGEVHSSWGLKRSISKFILYEGAILIAAGMDVLFLMSKVFVLCGLNFLEGVAIFTCVVAIVLCIVEILSLREKADEKTRKDIGRVSEMVENIIDRKQLSAAIAKAIAESIKPADTGKENV